MHIFLSYAREDNKFVAEFAAFFDAQSGVELFWDNMIEPGSSWLEKIASQVAEADALIVFVSAAACKS